MERTINKLIHYANDQRSDLKNQPTEDDVEKAFRTLLKWIGENPDREGLKDTPKRLMKAYREMFSGYNLCPLKELERTFEEISGYNDLVLLKNIDFHSHCEHHMAPIIGKAHIAYLPNKKIVGLSKIARAVDIFAHRLQTQETMTEEIATAIQDTLNPHGTAVIIEAEHMCMAIRGVHKRNIATITTSFKGIFYNNPEKQKYFLSMIHNGTSIV